MKELLVTFIFALIIGSGINGCMQTSTAPQSEGEPQAQTGSTAPGAAGGTSEGGATGSNLVQEVGDESFKSEVLGAQQPVLVDFWAEWCGPCKTMIPVVDQLASKYSDKLKVVRVDVDANEEVTTMYKVSALPTFMIFKNGKRMESLNGAMPAAELETALKKYMD